MMNTKQRWVENNKDKVEMNEGDAGRSSGDGTVDLTTDEIYKQWKDLISSQQCHSERIVQLEKICMELQVELNKWKNGKNMHHGCCSEKGEEENIHSVGEEKADDLDDSYNKEDEEISRVEETDLQGEEKSYENREEEEISQTSNEGRRNEGCMNSEGGTNYVFNAKKTTHGGTTMKLKFGSMNKFLNLNKNRGKFSRKRRFLGPCTGYSFVSQEETHCDHVSDGKEGEYSSKIISGEMEKGKELKRRNIRKEAKETKDLDEANETIEVGLELGVVFKVDTSSVIEKLIEMEKRAEPKTK